MSTKKLLGIHQYHKNQAGAIENVSVGEGSQFVIGKHGSYLKYIEIEIEPVDINISANERLKAVKLNIDQYTAVGGVENLRVMLSRNDGGNLPIDYFFMQEQSEIGNTKYSIDITNIIERLIIEGIANSTVRLEMIGGSFTSADAYISLEYNGFEMEWQTETVTAEDFSHRAQTHDLGRFGTAAIDGLYGNITFECTDFEGGGGHMPVTLKRTYNSAFCEISSPFGLGWRSSLSQSVVKSGEKYLYTDENGIVTELTLSDDKKYYKSADGDLKYYDETQVSFYSDFDYGNVNYIAEPRTLVDGESYYVFNENGTLAKIQDKYSNAISIAYDTDGNILTVTDGSDRSYLFNCIDGLVRSIVGPDNKSVGFEYSDDRLTSVTYPDGRNAALYYYNGCPYSVMLKAADGTPVLRYDYDFTFNRLVRITEYGYKNGVEYIGKTTEFKYSVRSLSTFAVMTEPAEDGEEQNVIKTICKYNSDGELIDKCSYTDGDGKMMLTDDGKGVITSSGNILKNGSFESGRDGWNGTGYADPVSVEQFDGTTALECQSLVDRQVCIYQSIDVKTDKNVRETYTLSGWAKGIGFPSVDRPHGINADYQPPVYAVYAKITYVPNTFKTYDENNNEVEMQESVLPEYHRAEFLPHLDDWQFASVTFAKEKYNAIKSMEIYCDASYNAGTVYFDELCLTRDGIETEVNDSDFADDTETSTSTDTSSEQQSASFDFKEAVDDYGNALTETTFDSEELGTIYRSFGYDDKGNVIRETDARGNETHYTVDAVTYRNTSVTDRCGSTAQYEYDTAGRTTKVTQEASNVAYSYNARDSLTEIVRGDGLKYALEYSAFNDLECIGIEGKDESLIRYEYKQGTGRLKKVSYANGHTMTATYNAAGQMTAEKWYESDTDQNAYVHYKYTYDEQGNVSGSLDLKALKYYTYVYTDGKITTACEYDVTIDEETVTSKTLVCTIEYTYSDDKLSQKKILVEGEKEQVVTYTNNDESKTTELQTRISGIARYFSRSMTDGLGRKEFDELSLGVGLLSRRFSYHEGKITAEHKEYAKVKSAPTTQLVSRIDYSDGTAILYEYDNEERITFVTELNGDQTVKVTEYTYDSLGQLIREDVNGSAVGNIYYDGYGNISFKDGVEYRYDGVWKDQLIQVGSKEISYDAQGNPTNYLGHTLTWEKGRQLKSFDSNTYTYNANGIRTSKTVDGVTHTYLLDGANILQESWGENTLKPLYNSEEEVCGIVYRNKYGYNTAYYFVKNLQGDIIALTNSRGETVARYSYDAWGKCTIVSDTSGNDIANINPYRYRGYYYDSEIDMYYLQSRYYDANVGRFVNADDPEILISEKKILNDNIFSYCQNDPINNLDASGKLISSFLFKVVAGVICGFIIQLLTDIIFYVIECILIGNRARLELDIWDYISSMVDMSLEFINPFNSKIKRVLLKSFLTLASKYAYRLIRGYNINSYVLIKDIFAAALNAIIEVALSYSAKRKIRQLKKYIKAKGTIKMKSIVIRKRLNIFGQYINFGITIASYVSDFIIKTLSDKKVYA